jgi:hypothetical protein
MRGQATWKDAVAGLVASWTMDQFRALWSRLRQGESDNQRVEAEGEDATMKAANLISEKILHRERRQREEPRPLRLSQIRAAAHRGLEKAA